MKDMIKNEKPLMWYKVRELSGKMNKTQVGFCLGIHRDTVRSYLSMSLDEFLNSNVLRKSYKKKLHVISKFQINVFRKNSTNSFLILIVDLIGLVHYMAFRVALS